MPSLSGLRYTTTMTLLRLLALSSITLVAACSSSSSSGISPTGPSASETCASHGSDDPATVCAAYASAYCTLTTKCSPLEANWASKEGCVEVRTAFCLSAVGLSGVSNAVGKFWREGVQLARATCYDPKPSTDATCETAGTLAADAPCVSDSQCQAGSYCRKTVSGISCGKCFARVAEGEACVNSPDCAPNLWCKSGLCHAPTALGEACTSAYECGDAAICSSKVCVANKPHAAKLNEACAYTTDCAYGLTCEGDVCVEQVFGKEGGNCSAFKPCDYGLVCTDKGKCITFVRGRACGAEILGCRLGQYCKNRTACTDKIAVGEACTAEDFNNDCVDGATCYRSKCVFIDDGVCK